MYTVHRLSAGLGFGDGAISAAGRPELAGMVDRSLTSPDLLVPVAVDVSGRPRDDDGCGDGRPAGGPVAARAKVFGGGATMAMAMRVGRGEAAGEDLADSYRLARSRLLERHIGFGGHTDSGAAADPLRSGCGAVDRAPEIMRAAGRYRRDIGRLLTTVFKVDPAGLDTVLDNLAANGEQEAYAGHATMEAIGRDGREVRQLDGAHQEMAIVLNRVPGYTIDQAKVRDETAGQAQVFAVDLWRVERLVTGLYDDAAGRRGARQAALAYTLATAAVLTAGDLPVYEAALTGA